MMLKLKLCSESGADQKSQSTASEEFRYPPSVSPIIHLLLYTYINITMILYCHWTVYRHAKFQLIRIVTTVLNCLTTRC